MGERIGAAFDKYWPVLISSLGAIILALTPILVGKKGTVHPFGVEVRQLDVLIGMVIIGVVLSAVGPVVLARSIKNDSATQASLEQRMRADTLWLYDDILAPMMERLHAVVRAGPEDVQGSYYSLITKACGEAASYLQDNDNLVRVNYYRLKGRAGNESLEVVFKTRRVARSVIDRTTDAGGMILDRTLRGDSEYCFDLLDPNYTDGNADGTSAYRCFASVAVKSDGVVYGMLSANTPEAGGMDASSKEFLQVFAAILAIAEEKLGEAKGRKIVT